MASKKKIIEVDEEPTPPASQLPAVQSVLAAGLSIRISDEPTAAKATDFLKQLKTLKKSIDDERKTMTGPLNESLRKINAKYKPVIEKIDALDSRIRQEMMRYRERVAAMVAAEHEAEGIEVIGKVDVPAAVGYTGATAGTAKTWTYEVVDFEQVPTMFKCIDDAEVKEAIKRGIREIPGLHIHEKEHLVIR